MAGTAAGSLSQPCINSHARCRRCCSRAAAITDLSAGLVSCPGPAKTLSTASLTIERITVIASTSSVGVAPALSRTARQASTCAALAGWAAISSSPASASSRESSSLSYSYCRGSRSRSSVNRPSINRDCSWARLLFGSNAGKITSLKDFTTACKTISARISIQITSSSSVASSSSRGEARPINQTSRTSWCDLPLRALRYPAPNTITMAL